MKTFFAKWDRNLPHLYDTCAAFALGTLAALFIPAIDHYSLVIGSLSSTFILFFAVLTFPFPWSGTALVAYWLMLLLFHSLNITLPADTSELLRLSIFATLILATQSFLTAFPLTLAISLVWLAYISFLYFCQVSDILLFSQFLPASIWRLVIQMHNEIIAVGLVELLRVSHTVSSLFRQNAKKFTLSVLSTHLLSLTVFVASAITIIIFFSQENILKAVSRDTELFLARILLLLAVAIFLFSSVSLLCSRLFRFFLTALNQSLDPQTSIFLSPNYIIPIQEVESTQKTVSRRGEELRLLRKRARELQFKVEELEQTSAQQIFALEMRQNIIARCPWGTAAITTDGKFVIANQEFCEILETNINSIVDTDYGNLLSSDKPWANEIVDSIALAIRRHKKLCKKFSRPRFSKSHNNQYLEIVTTAGSIPIDSAQRENSEDVLTQIVFAFARRVPDTRSFQLGRLNSDIFELMGAHTSELCSTLSGQLSDLAERLNWICSTAVTLEQSDSEFYQQIFEGQELLSEASATLTEIKKKVDRVTPSSEAIDLGMHLQHSLRYLSTLLGLRKELSLRIESDVVKTEGVELCPTGIVETDAILIKTSANELNRFTAYLLCLLKNIISQTNNLNLTLDYELIGTGTANLITGSLPGRYARLIIKHSGQSVAAYMMANGFSDLDSATTPLHNLPSAVCFLRYQIKRMNGLFSVQSSALRGTVITIYLPENTELCANQQVIKPPIVAYDRKDNLLLLADKPIILISGDPETKKVVDQTISNLGLQTVVRRPRDLVSALKNIKSDTSLSDKECSDSNAEECNSGKNFLSALSEQFLTDDFDILIFDLPELDSGSLILLEQLEKNAPQLKKLLLVDEDNSRQRDFGSWVPVCKPLTLESFSYAVEASARSL